MSTAEPSPATSCESARAGAAAQRAASAIAPDRHRICRLQRAKVRSTRSNRSQSAMTDPAHERNAPGSGRSFHFMVNETLPEG
ncbi:hypothetical protein WH87_02620 [Devosia epidermidihirudinis]|uniref:Uncharacterized protein n=1 Tax=Devosia epidermidihirudinis TaxID=1293439 RepID=A0A0F5QK53_9HYPH|nr:hypothetical protein WH87_02620 [Devosia epidermidihirudinis]